MSENEHIGTVAMTTEPTPTEIIAKLREDMVASPVDDVTVIDRSQLDVLSFALTPAPADRLGGIKPLNWDGFEARSPVGCYRVQRLDDKWEPLHNGYYMLPRLHGMVAAFGTVEEARASAEAHYQAAVLSCLAASEGSTDE